MTPYKNTAPLTLSEDRDDDKLSKYRDNDGWFLTRDLFKDCSTSTVAANTSVISARVPSERDEDISEAKDEDNEEEESYFETLRATDTTEYQQNVTTHISRMSHWFFSLFTSPTQSEASMVFSRPLSTKRCISPVSSVIFTED